MSIDKPEIDFPEGPAPTELEIVDLTEGDGPVAKAGDTVSVHYVGVSFSTGEEFDASWNRGKPLQFQLGAGQVIMRLGPGRAGHEGRRPPSADHPRAPGVRRPRCRMAAGSPRARR